MFRKFTKLYMVFLVGLIILGGVSIFLSGKPSEEERASLEEKAAQKTPGYATMTSLADIAGKHLEEDAILDIQVSPDEMREDALLQLQTTESATEDTLLKDTYDLLQDVQKIGSIETFTISWFMQLEDQNAEVLSLTLKKEELDELHTIRYSELPSITSKYVEHKALQ